MLEESDRWIAKTASAFNLMAAACVAAMMVLTCADVFLRLFRRPITGTYELVGFLGALFVSFSLANTSVLRGHIAVNFLVQRFSPRTRGMVMLVNDLIAAILFFLVTWQFFVYSRSLKAAGEVSMTLQIPVYPIACGVGFGSGLLFVVLFLRFLKSFILYVKSD
ncbi:MAG: TRAP transporter small permease [Desulfobacterales bacterium]